VTTPLTAEAAEASGALTGAVAFLARLTVFLFAAFFAAAFLPLERAVAARAAVFRRVAFHVVRGLAVFADFFTGRFAVALTAVFLAAFLAIHALFNWSAL